MKKRRGSVLCRCTWYMAQPGSLRDCSVNFSNSAETSASCPTFAIQVTANTTIVSLLPRRLAGEAILSFFRGRLQLRSEFIHQNRMVAIWAGRDHADFRTRLFLDECQIFSRQLWQFFVVGNAFGRSLPSRPLLVDALDLVPTAGLRGRFHGPLAVDFVSDTHRNLGQFVEHVELGDHQPVRTVDHARVAQQW